ncbi:MAG: hypothetical protein CBB71_13680 [Rhodopirellula sp. TMED11]|nr:MAG: hypothetical protein CBB71_13680 [Rhodopirellula sp. TMED11]
MTTEATRQTVTTLAKFATMNVDGFFEFLKSHIRSDPNLANETARPIGVFNSPLSFGRGREIP